MLKRQRTQTTYANRIRKNSALVKQRREVTRQVAQMNRRPIIFTPVGTETKYFDVSFSQTVSSAADWTGSEVPCTNYVQSDGATLGAYTDSALVPSAIGTGYGQINGNRYHLKKIRVRGALISVQASDRADVVGNANVRVVLVHDTRANGAQAQGEEVFTDMGTTLQAHFSFLSMGTNKTGRFRILKDETFNLNTAAASTDGANTTSVVRDGSEFSFVYQPKTPIECQLAATGATPAVSQIGGTNIFLLAHVTDSTGAVSLQGCARASYVG